MDINNHNAVKNRALAEAGSRCSAHPKQEAILVSAAGREGFEKIGIGFRRICRMHEDG